MEQLKPESSEKVASPSSELDTVFETFFHKIEELCQSLSRAWQKITQIQYSEYYPPLSKRYTYEDLAVLLKIVGFQLELRLCDAI